MLCIIQVITMVGFTSLLAAPSIAFIGTIDVLRRVANYGLSKPLRESLFAVVGPVNLKF